MLATASFRNFKALKAVDVTLTPFTVIVGKNAAGKTSVLQALLDLCALSVPRVGEKTPAERPALIFSGPHELARITTRPGGGPLRIEATSTKGHTMHVEGRIDAANVEFEVGVTGSDPPTITLPEQAMGARALLDSTTAKGFGSAVLLRLDARVMVRPSVASSEEPRLEYDGEGLASVLSYLAGYRPALVKAICADLTSVVPQVREILTKPVKVPRYEYNYAAQPVLGSQPWIYAPIQTADSGHRFLLDMGEGKLVDADLLSEGTVLALGLLTALWHPQCPSLLLLDDIDSALHSTAQVELVRCIRSVLAARKDLQIVCTSHSPDLLDQMDLEEVRVMALDEHGYAKCAPLSAHPKSAEWRSMLRTGEFWASVGEDWILGATAGA
jgi:hypothetical protein